ncbi:MAG: hypothetical protein K1X94_22355 [Sandaracinaceae bacterium]|nr:hypothetical protein [Sandaracinaceae bacterium]
MSHGESIGTRRLREQVEQALAASQSRKVIEPLLERLVHLAPRGSESSVLAHRTLAEYRLEEHPWRALLHLKHVLAVHPDDDVAHAMCGLAHAMSGHYRSAVASYRAASTSAPDNPWYHHNLGHLLDVALDRPGAALPHLRAAHQALGVEEAEVTASIIHCLGRLGARTRDEALSILATARRRHPKHASLLELARQLGAPTSAPRGRARAAAVAVPAPIPLRPRGGASRGEENEPARHTHDEAHRSRAASLDEDPVLAALRAHLGAHPSRFDTARRIWSRYCASQPRTRRGRPRNTDILAAAVHRLVMRTAAGASVTLASIARDYGVDPKAVAQRSQEIERALELA